MKNPRWWFWRAVVVPSGSSAITEDTYSSSDTQTPKVFLHKCASLRSLLVYANTAMPSYHISIICTRPLGRIDNVALKRWALFTVE
jgi:hypothetical protein